MEAKYKLEDKYKYGEGDTFVVREVNGTTHIATVIRCTDRIEQTFGVSINDVEYNIGLGSVVSSTVKSIPLHNAIIEYEYTDALKMVNVKSALRTDSNGNNALHILSWQYDKVVYKSMTLVDNKYHFKVDTEIQQRFKTLKAALLKYPGIETTRNSSGEIPGDMTRSLKFKL